MLLDPEIKKNRWPLARVIEVKKGIDGLVRSAKVGIPHTADPEDPKKTRRPKVYIRAIHHMAKIYDKPTDEELENMSDEQAAYHLQYQWINKVREVCPHREDLFFIKGELQLID